MHTNEVSPGLDLRQIVPYFQPVMDLANNTVWSYECLARQVTSGEQTFAPSEFLHLVEQQQCHGELTRTMFHRSAEYFRNINMAWAINISKEDILDPALAAFLKEYLTYYPNPGRITLELCAAIAHQHPEEFKSFLVLCKAMEIKVFLDQFGRCEKSKLKLLELPIDGIKINGELIKRLPSDEKAVERVSFLYQKASENSLQVVAEHIEDEESLAQVKALGIRYAQGFYFSRPQAST